MNVIRSTSIKHVTLQKTEGPSSHGSRLIITTFTSVEEGGQQTKA